MKITLNPESLEKALDAMDSQMLDSRRPYSSGEYILIAKAITAYLEAEAAADKRNGAVERW